jgi:diguanylate cyclase (GGDEF)-like protein/PAS domain S-box-containing protein
MHRKRGYREFAWPTAFAAAMALLCVSYFVIPGPAAATAISVLLTLMPAVAILSGIRLHRPAYRLPWGLLAFQQVINAVGTLVMVGQEQLHGQRIGIPTPADLPLLLVYPLLIGALLSLVKARNPGRDGVSLLDACIVTASLATLSWVFVISPSLHDAGLSLGGRLVGVAYPLMDMLMLAILARFLLDRGPRPLAYSTFVAYVVLTLVCDSLMVLARVDGSWRTDSPLVDGYVLAGVLLGVSALHPSMRRLTDPAPPGVARVSRVRIGGLLALATLVIPLLVTTQRLIGQRIDVVAIVAASLVLAVLAMLRMSILVQDLRRVMRQNADLHRAEHEERFRRLVRHSSDVITVVDHDLVVRYHTPSTEPVLGYGPDELLDTSLLDLVHPDDTPLVSAAIAGVLAERSVEPTVECRIRHKDGRYVWTETIPAFVGDDVQGCVLTSRDVTERRALQERLDHQAFYDPVTGLANRALFADRTRHALDRRRNAFAPLAVLFLDLDDFKTVNDSLGHAAGDELLAAVGRLLQAAMRPSDTVARLGGDEFAILLEGLGDETEATRVTERLLVALSRPVRVGAQDIPVPATVGIALADLDRVPQADDLVRDAEAAMYIAKQQGKGGYACFAPSMHEALVRKLEFTAELRAAVERAEFAVHYQPIVELADGRITGAEALVRWHHPTRGMVSPVEFIPVAEQTGLIVPLGRWVLEEACRQAARWQEAGFFKVNVNLSVRQLHEPGFLAEVVGALDRTGLPPRALCLEITETFLADEEGQGSALLGELKRVGVQLAIDDFGTGYSSLSRLQQYPLDTLKIPKPFVDGIAGGNTALARAIADLAGTLGLDVVAEGIETADQWAELRRLGCRYGQGFHFARPMPADGIDALVARPLALTEMGRLPSGR